MPEYVFSLIEKHQIQCEATQNGTIHAAHSLAGLKNLEARAQEWQRLGAPVELLTAKETESKTGTKGSTVVYWIIVLERSTLWVCERTS